jgi:hypothetical protein
MHRSGGFDTYKHRARKLGIKLPYVVALVHQHARHQTLAMLDTETGEVVNLTEGDGDASSEVRKRSESPSNLLSDSGLAKELLELVSDFEKRIAEFLEKSKEVEPADEHRRVKLAAGHVMAEVGERLLFPVFRRHKELIPEEFKGKLL